MSIIEIEELLYGRVSKVSSVDWCRMLKEVYDIDSSIAVLTGDYLLIEQTESLFTEGKLVRSYRVVYNTAIEHTSPDTKSLPSLDGAVEGEPEVYFDRLHDLFRVRYVHYLIEPSDFVSDLYDESTDPNVLPATQAPMSEHKEVCHSSPLSIKPVSSPIPVTSSKPSSPSITLSNSSPTITPQYPAKKSNQNNQSSFIEPHGDGLWHKAWRKRTLDQLRNLYVNGYGPKDIARIMDKAEASVWYQLKHYLHIDKPFTAPSWKSRVEHGPQHPI